MVFEILVPTASSLIGLLFVATVYYLQSGFSTLEFSRLQALDLVIGWATLVLVLFSHVLFLSLFQVASLPTVAVYVVSIPVTIYAAYRHFNRFVNLDQLFRKNTGKTVKWYHILTLGPAFLLPSVLSWSPPGSSSHDLLSAIAFLVLGLLHLIQIIFFSFSLWRSEEAHRNYLRTLELEVQSDHKEGPPGWSQEKRKDIARRLMEGLRTVDLPFETERPGAQEKPDWTSTDLSGPVLRYIPTVEKHGRIVLTIYLNQVDGTDNLRRAAIEVSIRALLKSEEISEESSDFAVITGLRRYSEGGRLEWVYLSKLETRRSTLEKIPQDVPPEEKLRFLDHWHFSRIIAFKNPPDGGGA